MPRVVFPELPPCRLTSPRFLPSVLPQAIDTVLKERVFRAARAKLGTDLDLFVMNSNASLLQVAALSRLPG